MTRALYVYCEIEGNPAAEPDKRGLAVYSEIAANPVFDDTRGLAVYSEVIPNPVLDERGLYVYSVIEPRLSPETPLELQLLDAVNWNIEKILGAK